MKFESAKQGYRNLWEKAVIRPERRATVEAIAKKLNSNRERYEGIAKAIGCPWWWVAITHQMESGANFATHLHNGDPLTARTRRVPAGRPRSGKPPFTWEFSALDALQSHGLDKIQSWSLERCLYEFERYNGWGYLGKINSPYLWSYTDLYVKGKYVADGMYDPSAISSQAGAVAILKGLIAIGAVSLTQDKETAMTELVSKVTQLRKLAPNLATVIEGKGSIDSAVGIQALAEKLEVEKDPTKISEKMEAVSLLNLIPILQAAEGLITSILPVDPEPVTPSVPDKKEEEQKSPIDEKFGLTGYKTLIGLGVCVLVWILQTLGVVDPTIATVGWGVGVFIGGAGAKAWLDRLGISLSKKSVQ